MDMDTTKFLFYAVIVSFLCSCVNTQHWDNASALHDSLLSGYNKQLRPVLNQSRPIIVNVSFTLLALHDIDELAGTFSVIGSLALLWNDEKLTWNFWEQNGIQTLMFPVKDIWYPPMAMSNPYTEVNDLAEDWMRVRVYGYNGMVVFTPLRVFDATCTMDVKYYPFDTQICWMSFSAIPYTHSEVQLVSTSAIDSSYFSPNGEWSLNETNIYLNNTGYSDYIGFVFVFTRKSNFIVVNVIVPIIFMVGLNILVFLIPADSGERISYAMTVLLALAVFLTLVGDNLPKSSDPMPIMSYFLMAILILSTSMCVVTILNLRLFHKNENSQPPTCFKRFARGLLCYKCRFDSKTKGKPRGAKTKYIHNGENGQIAEQTTQSGDVIDQDQGDNLDVSWKNVSEAVDVIAIFVFSIAIVVINVIFILTLKNYEVPESYAAYATYK